MTEVQATIQALATVESLVNPIDTLAVLDKQIKSLTAQTKVIKDDLANSLGEGKHRGEKYGVRITIENRKGSVDMEALCKAFGISEADLDKFRGESSAVIKVAAIA
ncbi:hypothetical protein UFOVP239_22 [uncultured Caudovirales phage]|uniref:Uncharacterized protein n=1 Tax=uncultured Caudovirales phage TaxID=2100421 RepID=A0A6J7WTG1_9CAUD|nr:hypothetical protein UFOVP239_22 [uncultured Caudovirales phage]